MSSSIFSYFNISRANTTHYNNDNESIVSSESGKSDILDIKGDELENEAEKARLNLGKLDMWFLGITIVIGGQYFAWNAGLTAGFGSYVLATAIVTGGYVALIFCSAELSGALPFAGMLKLICKYKFLLYILLTTFKINSMYFYLRWCIWHRSRNFGDYSRFLNSLF
jgi:hypothetical protein